MTSTWNGSSESWSCFTHFSSTAASKIARTLILSLTLAVSLVGNSLIVMIVYETPSIRKPINYFIANMAMSDLLYPIFWLPSELSSLYTSAWLIGGQFGQALCKLVNFLVSVSSTVSIHNLIMIAVNRFGAVVFPLRSPPIRSKLCPFFILATWIVAAAVNSPDLFAYELVEYSTFEKAFGESSSYANNVIAYYMLFKYIPLMLLAILNSIILISLKALVHPSEQSANTKQQWNRRNRNVLKLSIAIVLVFVFCWLPYTINYIIIYWAIFNHFSCGFLLYVIVTSIMVDAYCALNPAICFSFSSNYRQGLRRLINCSTVVQE